MKDSQYAWLTSLLGARTPTKDTADATLARLGTLRAVALDALRAWRADLLARPTTVTVPGAVSVGYAGALAALDRLIVDVDGGPDDPSAPHDVDDRAFQVTFLVPDHTR